jgi:hypothetical protein
MQELRFTNFLENKSKKIGKAQFFSLSPINPLFDFLKKILYNIL